MVAENRPGASNTTSGVGSTQHVGGEAFGLSTGTKSTHIPYKGSSQAHIDLISGEVSMMFDSASSAMSQIKAGKLRPLAVTADKRAAELPDVPTLSEQGVRGADVQTWYGLYVTGDTPRATVDRLAAELTRVLKLPKCRPASRAWAARSTSCRSSSSPT